MNANKKYIRHYKGKIMINKNLAGIYIEKKKMLESIKKEVDDIEDSLKSELLEYLSVDNKSISSNGIIASYINGSIRKSIDSKLLEEKYPNIYSECLIEKESKSYIKLNV